MEGMMKMLNKIMVVDDSTMNRMLLAEVLSETFEGYEIVEAENGQDALDKLDDSVALIYLDLIMPVMDGYQFLETVVTKAPIVAIDSGCADPDRVYGLGASFIVERPFDQEKIRHLSKYLVTNYKMITALENELNELKGK